MTSRKTQIPLDHYWLPFCQPEGGPRSKEMTFGQYLSGDSIRASPYKLLMKKDMFCEQLCVSNLGRSQYSGVAPNRVVRTIRNEYHSNWLLDGLPPASILETDSTITTRYWQGFPVGFVDEDDNRAYIYNHVNFFVAYEETSNGSYRVVGFRVEPFSIKHEFESLEPGKDQDPSDGRYSPAVAKLVNPISACRPDGPRGGRHVDYEMVTAIGRSPQPASGLVLFTYDGESKPGSTCRCDQL